MTCNPDGDSYAPSLNDGGGVVAFVSRPRIHGWRPAGIRRCYVYQYKIANPTEEDWCCTLANQPTPYRGGHGAERRARC